MVDFCSKGANAQKLTWPIFTGEISHLLVDSILPLGMQGEVSESPCESMTRSFVSGTKGINQSLSVE